MHWMKQKRIQRIGNPSGPDHRDDIGITVNLIFSGKPHEGTSSMI